MAKILSKSTIVSLGIIRPWHVTQSIDAFSGTDAYDISLSGSFTTTGSLNIKGPSTFTNGPITASVPVSIGPATIATGISSFSQGSGSKATGDYGNAHGRGARATGFAAHAEGLTSIAEGSYSHAEGRLTIASGSYSHAQGRLTTASGDYSNAGGYGTIASGNYQLVAGQFNIPKPGDNSSLIIGNGVDTNNRSNILFAGTNKIELNAPVTASSNISASGIVYMTTASIGGGIFTSASLAATSGGGGGGGSTFPFTGDAQITGSLLVTGSSFISGTLHLMHPEPTSPIIKANNESFLFYVGNNYHVGNTGGDLNFLGSSIIFNNGHITASVNISSSANIIAKTGSFSHLQGNSPITVGDQITFQQPVTASTISASGNLTALDLNLFGGDIDLKNGGSPSTIKLYCESSNAHYTQLQAASHSAYSGNVLTVLPPYDFDFAAPNFQANVTASTFNGDGSALTNLQRPISNSVIFPFTASNSNSGFYFRAGGNVTCSIQSSSLVSCNVGNEFEIFQTSSAGYVLFLTGSGVTLNSKGGNIKLAGQFSAATLKKVGNNEWDLIGDLG